MAREVENTMHMEGLRVGLAQPAKSQRTCCCLWLHNAGYGEDGARLFPKVH